MTTKETTMTRTAIHVGSTTIPSTGDPVADNRAAMLAFHRKAAEALRERGNIARAELHERDARKLED